MDTLRQRKTQQKHERPFGAALTEYILILGVALFGTVFVYQQYGKGVRFHGATLSKELAGEENGSEIWSPTLESLTSGGYTWGGGSASGTGGNGNTGGGVGSPGSGGPGGSNR